MDHGRLGNVQGARRRSGKVQGNAAAASIDEVDDKELEKGRAATASVGGDEVGDDKAPFKTEHFESQGMGLEICALREFSVWRATWGRALSC